MTATTGLTPNQQLVTDFFAAMGPTLEEFKDNYRDRLTEDALWESVGHPPRRGRAACIEYLDELNVRTGMEWCTVDVLHLSSTAETVLTERVDTMRRADGTPITSFRIMGAIEIRDGKIARYTDYFDTAAAIGPPPPTTPGGSGGRAPASPRSYSDVDPPAEAPGSPAWKHWATGLPASRAMGLHCRTMTSGEVSMVMNDSVWPLNPNGSLHGGLVIAAADHSMGIAAMTAQKAGQFVATASLTHDYYAPATPPVTFHAQVTRRARSLVFVELSVVDADERRRGRASGVWAVHSPSEKQGLT